VLRVGVLRQSTYLWTQHVLAGRELGLTDANIANIAFGYVCGLAMIWPEVLFSQMAIYTLVGFIWGVLKRKDIGAGLTKAA
jgi:hypothetical protein